MSMIDRVNRMSQRRIEYEGSDVQTTQGSRVFTKKLLRKNSMSKKKSRHASLPKRHPEPIDEELDPLDPKNYQHEKSEFYWKLHDLTLKIKDFVSNFPEPVKPNPIDEIIKKAISTNKIKKLRRRESMKKLHKGASYLRLSRCDSTISQIRKEGSQIPKSICSRDDLVINLVDCPSSKDIFTSNSPQKRLPAKFFSKPIRKSSSVSSLCSVQSQIGESDPDEGLVVGDDYFHLKDSELLDQSFQKRVEEISETNQKTVINSDLRHVIKEGQFIQRTSIQQKGRQDKDAITQNKTKAMKLIDISSKDFTPIKLTSKNREIFQVQSLTTTENTPVTNPSQGEATTEPKTTLPEIGPRSRVFRDSKRKYKELKRSSVLSQRNSLESIGCGNREDFTSLLAKTEQKEAGLKKMIKKGNILRKEASNILVPGKGSRRGNPYIKKSLLRYQKSKSIKNLIELREKTSRARPICKRGKCSSRTRLDLKLTSYI